MKHYLIPTTVFLLAATFCSAQSISEVSKGLAIDSIRKMQMEQAALRNPVLRQINISTDVITRGDISGKINGDPLFKGKASTVRTTALFNVPVKSWGKNSVSTSISYFQQRLKVDEVQSFQPGLSNDDVIFNKSTVGLTASFQRRDSLFGKPVFYMASVSGVTNDAGSIKKLSYLGTALFPIKQTATTRYSAGVVINIDPSLKIPAFLLFTYWHKFKNDLEFNLNLPSQIAFRKGLSDRLSATAGTSLSGSLAFFELNQPNVPHDANYTTIDLKTGIGVEYRIGKKFVFGMNGGILTPLSARAFDRTKTSDEYFLNNKISNAPYVNFSFSVLPFF
ncbi:DUF6268 family outer membrane beta-barrel protein [Pedobacter metabolipauper]|uniref:DUF6268 domain-containing protein n=1 Tax=Pedobacter metabolipauper TaxID=425513 RepID=A0A4R6SXD7_9SPHI|nr:DUF6268 family outer membrane beta-barrel protein [Pedobacter metabolipauper]TDQ11184.1 hypothetical protein ATK78_0300 [Pedobacter metabolipauper]